MLPKDLHHRDQKYVYIWHFDTVHWSICNVFLIEYIDRYTYAHSYICIHQGVCIQDTLFCYVENIFEVSVKPRGVAKKKKKWNLAIAFPKSWLLWSFKYNSNLIIVDIGKFLLVVKVKLCAGFITCVPVCMRVCVCVCSFRRFCYNLDSTSGKYSLAFM